jgi:hypothetical protein
LSSVFIAADRQGAGVEIARIGLQHIVLRAHAEFGVAVRDALDQRIAVGAELGHHFARRIAEGDQQVARRFARHDLVVGDQARERHRMAHVVFGGDFLGDRLAGELHGLFEIGRQRVPLAHIDADFLGRGGFLDARIVVVFGDLMQAERPVRERPDEFGRIDGARLQGGEDFARRQRDDGSAGAPKHFAAQARRAETQAAEIVDRAQFAPEPAQPLRTRIAADERLHAEAPVDFVVQRLAAAMHHPALLFEGGHAERKRAEETDARRFRNPEGRHAVVEIGRARRDCVEGTRGRHNFARREQTHRNAAARDKADAVGDFLRSNAGTGQIARPQRDHAPFDAVLRQRGGGKTGTRSGGDTGQKMATFHEGGLSVCGCCSRQY